MTPEETAARNAEIVAVRRSGEKSLEELAAKFNISRERVRQISEAGGVDNKAATKAYYERKTQQNVNAAEEKADVILMHYVMGKMVKEISEATGVPQNAVQLIIDEQVTDEIIAARNNNRMKQRFPERDAGPRLKSQPRDDRFWTPERVFAALVVLAQQEGGRLPSSTQYQKLAPKREELPSFATVRNRLGRWSSVRADIHAHLKEK